MAEVIDVRVAENGRMVLPLAVRKAMGLTGEGRVILTVEGDEVRLYPVSHAVRRVQDLYRQHAKHARDVDAFLEERRAEAARNAGEPDAPGGAV